jgi:3-oxoacyl-[acyl-carrier protein] reductase
VAVTDFDAEGAQAFADEIGAAGGTARAWRLDVGDATAISTTIDAIAAHFGGFDIVVNNAGILVRAAIDDPGFDEA